jgi:hypothetical protein
MKKPAELPTRGRAGMNLSHHGSDEQMFGAKQQGAEARATKKSIFPQ